MFTTNITTLPDNYRFDHLPTNNSTDGYKIATSYLVSENVLGSKVKALIDRGANGGIV